MTKGFSPPTSSSSFSYRLDLKKIPRKKKDSYSFLFQCLIEKFSRKMKSSHLSDGEKIVSFSFSLVSCCVFWQRRTRKIPKPISQKREIKNRAGGKCRVTGIWKEEPPCALSPMQPKKEPTDGFPPNSFSPLPSFLPSPPFCTQTTSFFHFVSLSKPILLLPLLLNPSIPEWGKREEGREKEEEKNSLLFPANWKTPETTSPAREGGC